VAEYTWPERGKRSVLGTPVARIDGPDKVSGRAKYTFDVDRPGMLHCGLVRCPHAHAKVVSIDTSAAERMPGVKAVHVVQGPGTEIFWAGDDVVALAAVDERVAEDAVRVVKVQYEVLPHNVVDDDLARAGVWAKPMADQTKGDAAAALREAEIVVEGEYGARVITHCCLESHCGVVEWENEKNLLVHISTQNVSGIASQMAGPLGIPAGDIRVKQDHIGGGFGSKFGPDRWVIVAAELSKKAGGVPVKVAPDRRSEQALAGARPSAYAKVKIGAKKDGTITAWHSETWGTGGMGGGGAIPVPYVFDIPNQLKKNTGIDNNIGSARAWRAPGHPQACLVTMSAIEDLGARLAMDPLELVLKNTALLGARAKTYEDELKIGADLIEWKKKWHPRGDKAAGPIKRGLGLSLHTWGGRGHNSAGDLTLYPDGSVEIKMGTQDLGTGTRTALAIVIADTLGIPVGAVKVLIGDSRYPASGASGGSTTIGGVSSAARRGSLDLLDQLFAKVAPALGVQPADLEAVGGKVRVKADPTKALAWSDACAKIGAMPLTVRGSNPGPGNLIDGGVGGIQMAEVAVDVETGIVKLERLVAVQDCGLIVNKKLSESQCYGAMIMGISYALFEEKVMDAATGLPLNADMEFYKLAGLGDIGELVVHMMTGPGYDERGVIGLGEPPVVSPGAAIGNAVANAIGVRVSQMPFTPDRVLAALERRRG
jgi:xanthine dehydrogenase YagR molybdenum-binding subunit